ncbi:putative virus X resistance protein-like, coiled-coil [Helianthus annuus]|nr:putative virus X resistance protein-like, coiled-coil [Helianthus annuus]
MGDVAISALVSEVVGRLTSKVIKELALLWGLEDDISTLQEDFTSIQAILEDAEEKHIKEKAVKLWLKSLRSASLEVENVLDEISTEALLQRLHKQRGAAWRVRAFFSSDHNKLLFRIRIAHKVKSIRRKLDAIASKRFELKLTPSSDIRHLDVGFKGVMPHRETSSLIHSSLVFGRNDEMELAIEKIFNKDIGKYDSSEIRVYGIWGMGGVGKTTLAQLIYNHERVKQYFELKCWVYVSENFQVKEIIKGIIASIDKCECTLTHLDVLQESLQNKLRGKKFLIVLDDVWIEEDEKAKWDEVSKTLSCGAEESIVVMTTRYDTTSRMTAKVRELQHELGCLSEVYSWLLFKKFAFAEGREGDDISKLEPIGREMVEKCKGLPLAVKTLGSLMWSKRSISDWQRVKCNILWELQESKVLPALKLSYDNLLPHLKRCFAYCCMFPKGYYMEKDVVIQSWVANDFIPPRGDIDLYMLGEEIFNFLVWRSFFQVDKNHNNNFKMHDLMHDMAQHVMGDDFLVIESDKEIIIPNEALHLSSSCPYYRFSPQELEKLRSLRSIFMFGDKYEPSATFMPISIFGDKYECSNTQLFNHMYMRVLYLSGIKLITLPESICKLKHLKYLNLSYSSIAYLPESIVYLQNLQVLILRSCRKLYCLPKGLRYMTNLERLDIAYCDLLTRLPIGIRELTSLRILPRFPVGYKCGAKLGELGDLNLLEGELEISQLVNAGASSEARSANLKCKRNLLVLKLNWFDPFRKESRQEMFAYEEVLEGLEPNQSLKKMIISKYMGNNISPKWMVNLRNLVEIQFFWCMNCEHIPSLGILPNLRVIKLSFMHSLKCFHDDEINMFTCLRELDIGCCPNLVSLPCNLPRLEVLKLERCGGLISLPSYLPNITKLKLSYCDGLVSLPDEIKSFKYLNELEINRCKHLSKRCEKENGVDWHKISHIPKFKTYSSGNIGFFVLYSIYILIAIYSRSSSKQYWNFLNSDNERLKDDC